MAKTQIVLPKVEAFFEDAEAGARVDEVLTKLTSELQSLKAADVSAVAGNDPAMVGSSGFFFQTFENDVTTTWTGRTTAGAVTYPSNGQAGGRAFRSTGGESFYEFPENIPFVDDRLYRIRCKVRMVTAPADSAKDLISVGVQGYGADGTTLVDINGTTTATDFHAYAMANVDMGALSLGTWYTYTGYFSGWGTASSTPSTDADAPRAMDTDVRYIRPAFRLNHAAGDGVMEIDYISLEVLTEGPESNQTLKDVVNLGTGKVASNKVVADSITAGVITGTHINGTNLSALFADLGTITAGWIGNAVPASATAAIRLTGSTALPSTNFIDFTATGSGVWLKNPFLTLPAATGTATFSGNLSAAGGDFAGDLKANTITLKTATGATAGSIITTLSGGWGLKDDGGTTRVSILSDSGGRLYVNTRLDIAPTYSIDFGASYPATFGQKTLPTSAGTSSGTYWEVKINGTTYHIDLLNTS